MQLRPPPYPGPFSSADAQTTVGWVLSPYDYRDFESIWLVFRVFCMIWSLFSREKKDRFVPLIFTGSSYLSDMPFKSFAFQDGRTLL